MKIRHAKEDELKDIKNIWNYCFNDGESFVEYYFKDKYKFVKRPFYNNSGIVGRTKALEKGIEKCIEHFEKRL